MDSNQLPDRESDAIPLCHDFCPTVDVQTELTGK